MTGFLRSSDGPTAERISLPTACLACFDDLMNIIVSNRERCWLRKSLACSYQHIYVFATLFLSGHARCAAHLDWSPSTRAHTESHSHVVQVVNLDAMLEERRIKFISKACHSSKGPAHVKLEHEILHRQSTSHTSEGLGPQHAMFRLSSNATRTGLLD